MPIENNRMLLELDRTLKKVNQAEINPLMPTLTLAQIEPVLSVVARARGTYLKALFDMGKNNESGLPSEQQIGELRAHRVIYEELMSGAQALQTAIERGYLEVE